jgi:thiosulfate/3-mercaptopyruvate sulfurtransferase
MKNARQRSRAARVSKRPSHVRGRLLTCAALVALLAARCIAGEKGLDPSAIPRLLPLTEPAAPEQYGRPEALTQTAQLAQWLETPIPKTVVIDGRDATSFKLGHLAGARNIQSDLFQDADLPPYYMPPASALQRICALEGIGPETRVVVYDQADGRLAARIWFTLHAYGHEHVTILNGGLARWQDEHRATNTSLPALDGTGTFVPLTALRGACTFADLARYRVRVQTMGKLPTVTLLDARSRAEYMGEDARGKIGGHIPGAVNLPWSAMLGSPEKGSLWRSPQEIHAILRLANVDRSVPIALYDQAGGRSAHLYFTLWLMGFDNLANYVAGWREYGNHTEVEVEK